MLYMYWIRETCRGRGRRRKSVVTKSFKLEIVTIPSERETRGVAHLTIVHAEKPFPLSWERGRDVKHSRR